MTLKNGAKFKKKTFRFKIDMRNLTNFDSITQKSQKCTLYWAAFDQSINVSAKKCRGVMSDGIQCWCKNCRKTDLCFQKWHEEFDKFSTEHSKALNLGLWSEPFIQSRKCINLRFTWELSVLKNEEWCNWLVSLKLTWVISRILTWALKILKNLHFNGLLLTKVYSISFWML